MIFDGLEFGITGRGKDVALARQLVEGYGGTVTAREHASQFGIIVGSNNPSVKKVAIAQAYGVPSVSVEWLEQCVKAGKVIPKEVTGSKPEPAPSSNKPLRGKRVSPPRKMIFDFDEDETPDKKKGMRFSMTPPNYKKTFEEQFSPERRAQSPKGNVLKRAAMKPLFPRAINASQHPSQAINQPPQIPQVARVVAQAPPPSSAPQTVTAPVSQPPPIPSTIASKQSIASTLYVPPPHIAGPRPTSGRPTAVATRPTTASRPTSPAPQPSRINSQRKPPVPRLAPQKPDQDSKSSADALLAKVLQHPAGKSIDAEAAKQVLLQIVDTASPVTFSDISGLENCKQILQEAVILPAKRPELFTGLRKPCSALLLFGPPGNGKTMLAKAVACECDTTFFNISASAITSKWVGDSEKLVRALFGVARALSPATIFIDEIDSMLQSRGSSNEMEGSRRLKTEFLVQMDGAGNDYSSYRVLIMGATNRPYDLDDAVLRRFPKRVLVPLPDVTTRHKLITSLLNDTRSEFSQVEWKKFAEMTENYSASDLSQLCKDMALAPIRDLGIRALEVSVDDLRPLNMGDAVECMKSIRASTTTSQLDKLFTWNTEFGSSK
jgi:spastin